MRRARCPVRGATCTALADRVPFRVPGSMSRSPGRWTARALMALLAPFAPGIARKWSRNSCRRKCGRRPTHACRTAGRRRSCASRQPSSRAFACPFSDPRASGKPASRSAGTRRRDRSSASPPARRSVRVAHRASRFGAANQQPLAVREPRRRERRDARRGHAPCFTGTRRQDRDDRRIALQTRNPSAVGRQHRPGSVAEAHGRRSAPTMS